MAEPFVDFVITEHAALEIERRGLAEEVVGAVLRAPEQQIEIRPGRVVLQSRLGLGSPSRVYLVRVFLDVDRRPAEVVTAYRTSKIAKYWRREP